MLGLGFWLVARLGYIGGSAARNLASSGGGVQLIDLADLSFASGVASPSASAISWQYSGVYSG